MTGTALPDVNPKRQQGVVIYGPQGCGKSAHATALANHYGKTRVVDDWEPGGPVPADTLALTSAACDGAIHFLEAANAAGIRLAPAVVLALSKDRRNA